MASTQAPVQNRNMIITSLATHPIKSLRPIAVPSITLTSLGPIHDRRFLLLRLPQPGLIDKEQILCLAHYSQLCLFLQAFDPPGVTPEEAESIVVEYIPPENIPTERAKNGILLGKSRKQLKVPLRPDLGVLQARSIVMHHSSCIGYDMGDSYSAFFSECLGIDVRLVCLGTSKRKVLGNVAPVPSEILKPAGGWLNALSKGLLGGQSVQEDTEEYAITFADCAQVLVTTTPSLDDVSSRLQNRRTQTNKDQPGMDMSKFRPNIVVSPSPDNPTEFAAWEEDYWAELEIYSHEQEFETVNILLTQNTGRCRSINVEYDTGKFGDMKSGGEEPLKYLMKDRRVDPGTKWSPIFGRYGFLGSRGMHSEVYLHDSH